MKFRKIQKLEFVSDKIEGGNSKRKIVHICFGHLTNEKQPWIELSIGRSHDQTSSSMSGHGGARRRGKRGGRVGERGRGRGCGEKEGREGHHGGILGELGPLLVHEPPVRAYSLVSALCRMKEEEKRRARKQKEERKRKKEKEKNKMGIFSKNFVEKIKDNLGN
jgi:hypothetical protein